VLTEGAFLVAWETREPEDKRNSYVTAEHWRRFPFGGAAHPQMDTTLTDAKAFVEHLRTIPHLHEVHLTLCLEL
jgi:hypothetical protein